MPMVGEICVEREAPHRRWTVYQKVMPPPVEDPVQKLPFFWPTLTLWPCMAATWAALGATPGGAGGTTAWLMPLKRALPSN
jgi:hypothetical protein